MQLVIYHLLVKKVGYESKDTHDNSKNDYQTLMRYKAYKNAGRELTQEQVKYQQKKSS